MQTVQAIYRNQQWESKLKPLPHAQWVLALGDRGLIQRPEVQQALQEAYPNAEIVGCSTSGEIADTQVYDKSLIVTAVQFSRAKVKGVNVNIKQFANSKEAAKALCEHLPQDNLNYVLVLSDGQHVNGTALVDGMKEYLSAPVLITGGLAGDDDRFEQTCVWHNQKIESGLIVALGFYGDSIMVGHGSLGGWDTFGPSRLITRSSENKLFTLDNKNALELYKEYLGEFAEKLPASALLFPLAVSEIEDGDYVVRTILSIDEQEQSMTFAGDMPEGQYARLMRANFDRLIDGAHHAATNALSTLTEGKPRLALLISCVGRRLVLGQRVEEELEEVREVIGDECIMTGFYSYGEISPLVEAMDCRLHNQTMTITTFSEK
jgi:hypothetical protein